MASIAVKEDFDDEGHLCYDISGVEDGIKNFNVFDDENENGDDSCDEEDQSNDLFKQVESHMRKITDDGGVKKHILRPGVGKPAGFGKEVKITYTLFAEGANEPWESVRRPISLLIGSREKIAGFHHAVATMCLNEEALFLIGPEYGFGRFGAVDFQEKNSDVLLKGFDDLTSKAPAGPDCKLLLKVKLIRILEKSSIKELLQSAEFRFEEGKKMFGKGRFRDAKKIYEDLLSEFEHSPLGKEDGEKEEEQARSLQHRLFLNIAVCHLKLKEFRAVTRRCMKAIETNEKDPKLYYLMGRAFYGLNETDAALHNARAARRLKPNDCDVGKLLIDIETKMRQIGPIEQNIAKGFNQELQLGERPLARVVPTSAAFNAMIRKRLETIQQDLNNEKQEVLVPVAAYNEAELEYFRITAAKFNLSCNATGAGNNLTLRFRKLHA